MNLEPDGRETVVIDPGAVTNNGLGHDAWHKEEFRVKRGQMGSAPSTMVAFTSGQEYYSAEFRVVPRSPRG